MRPFILRFVLKNSNKKDFNGDRKAPEIKHNQKKCKKNEKSS